MIRVTILKIRMLWLDNKFQNCNYLFKFRPEKNKPVAAPKKNDKKDDMSKKFKFE